MSEGSFDPALTKLTRVYSDRLEPTRARHDATEAMDFRLQSP